jgi:hypothetical protein
MLPAFFALWWQIAFAPLEAAAWLAFAPQDERITRRS